MSIEELNKAYIEAKGKLEEALKKAEKYGKIIGFVSRLAPSRIGSDGSLVQFEVDPLEYFRSHEEVSVAGSYLAAVDVKTGEVVSLRIKNVERRDVMSELGIPEAIALQTQLDASGLVTRARVVAEPLLAWNPEKDEVKAAAYVIEPQSPIIKPNPEIFEKILGLPEEGVVLGLLAIGEKPLDVKIKLPLHALYQHMLVLGTTGAGKTTFIKNFIIALLNKLSFSVEEGYEPTIVVLDSTKDYVHMVLESVWKLEKNVETEEFIAEKVFGNIRNISKAKIIIPVTKQLCEKLRKYCERIGSKPRTINEYLEVLGKYYVESSYFSIVEKILNGVVSSVDVEVKGYGPLRRIIVELTYSTSTGTKKTYLTLIPYAFSFKELKGPELAILNPFLTSQARDHLPRIINAFEEYGYKLTTLTDFLEALREALFKKGSEAYNIVFSRLGVHKGTVENIVRSLGILDDSGIFDVILGNEIVGEPNLNAILENSKNELIIVDLAFLKENVPLVSGNVENIVALRILYKVFMWKMLRYAERAKTQPTIVIVDEAHRFFPAAGGGEGEYVMQVSNMLATIARLGRARRLSIIFATHSPKDVHDIVLQLANTKVIFRMDPAVIDKLDIPSEYRHLISRIKDRYALVKTHALRLGYVLMCTPLPVAGHFDLSVI